MSTEISIDQAGEHILNDTTSVRVAQACSLPRSWYIKLWHWLTPWVGRRVPFTGGSAVVYLNRVPHFTCISQVWEQVDVHAQDVQIERDCRLVWERKQTECVDLEYGKVYWLVLDKHDVEEQLSTQLK